MKAYHNLLPMKFQKQLLLRKVLRRWMIIGGTAILLMLGISFLKYSSMNEGQNRLDRLNEQAKPLRNLTVSNNQLRQKIKTLSEKKQTIASIANANVHLQLLGLISQNASYRSNNLQVIGYTLEETSRGQKTTPSKVAKNKLQTVESSPQMRLNLKGIAVDEATVAGFMKSLENENLFESVNLKSINRVELSNKTIQSYQIICLF